MTNLPPTLVDEYTFGLIFEVLDKLPGKKNPHIVELGSFLGGSITRIYDKCMELHFVPTLTAIDNWECDNISPESREWSGTHNNFYEKFKENTGDLIIFSIKEDTLVAASKYEDESIDLLFIDDGHQYPHTKEILKVWLPKVKKNGYIVGHDYSTNGVKMAIEEVLNAKIVVCETMSGYRYQKC